MEVIFFLLVYVHPNDFIALHQFAASVQVPSVKDIRVGRHGSLFAIPAAPHADCLRKFLHNYLLGMSPDVPLRIALSSF